MQNKINFTIRKNIISFAWTWIGLLIFVGIISLFSIWSMNHEYDRGAETAFKTSALKNEVSSASITFKVQIQEWKNILLRGGDAADRDLYYAEFEKHESSVNTYLENAQRMCMELGLGESCAEISTIQSAHQALGAGYKSKLSQTSQASLMRYETIHQIDQSVRGMDRDIDASMTQLNAHFSAIEIKLHKHTRQTLADKYHSLRKFILSVLTLSLIVAGFSLYGVLRATRA